MTVNELIDKLIIYACDELGFSELDVDGARMQLTSILNAPVKHDGKKGEARTATLKELKAGVAAFHANAALKAGAEELFDGVMSLVTPQSSSVDKLFKTIRERMNAQKAEQYLYGLAVKSGYVGEDDLVLVSDGGKINCALRGEFAAENKPSPLKRRVMLSLQSDHYFSYERRPDICEQASLVPVDGDYPLDAETFENVFDLVDYLPDYFVTGAYVEGAKECGGFTAGKERLPLFSSHAVCSFRSDAYPDADVAELDFLLPAVRLAGYNKNALISLSLELMKSFSSLDVGARRGKNVNFSRFYLRILSDGRYCLDIVLLNGKNTDFDLGKELKFSKFIDNRCPESLIAGKLVFKHELNELVKKAASCLSGKFPSFGDVNDNPLYPLSDAIAAVRDGGASLSASNAENGIYSALAVAAEEQMTARNVFAFSPMGVKMFLSALGVNKL